MTEKENLLLMHRGEEPEWLPRGNFRDVKCGFFEDIKKPGYHKDEFGVEYIGKDDVFGGAPIPMPGKYVLHDITKWRDVIKAPDMSGFDWEAQAKKDLADIDRNTTGIMFYFGKTFQRLCDFMGFEEGLCAMMEEPEEVYALFDYLTDFNVEVLKNFIHYYKPEAVCIPDDTATARNPFISLPTFRELVLPFYKRIAEVVHDGGVYLHKHDCGHCEAFIPDWMNEMGVCGWNPAQPSNDLAGIKKTWGSKLIIAGGWDTQGPVAVGDVTEQELKDMLAEYVDTLAPGGGFIFSAYVGGNFKDPETRKKNQIVTDFYNDYAKPWYKNHRS